MYNEITCDEVKSILRGDMFYNAVNLDTLNYIEEEAAFAGGVRSDDAVIFADRCAHTDTHDVTNNVYVCPVDKNFDCAAAAELVEKAFRAKSISVDVQLLGADAANAVKARFSSICPYRREIKDYAAKDVTAAENAPVRLVSPFYVFLLRQSMISIPRELFEAAQIDGAGSIRCYFHVALPLSKAIIGAAAALSFADCWNLVEQPLVFLPTRSDLYPLSVAFNQLSQKSTGTEFAGAALYILPAMMIYLFFQKDIMTSIQLSEMK